MISKSICRVADCAQIAQQLAPRAQPPAGPPPAQAPPGAEVEQQWTEEEMQQWEAEQAQGTNEGQQDWPEPVRRHTQLTPPSDLRPLIPAL